MFIRKGKYYLMWSEGGWTNGTYKVAYGVADSVWESFEKNLPSWWQMRKWQRVQGTTQ
jgi:hypothetical protein